MSYPQELKKKGIELEVYKEEVKEVEPEKEVELEKVEEE